MAKITSNINARSKKSKAELDAIGNKKPILDDNKAGKQALENMDSDIANRKKEKKDFLNLTATDRSKMSLEQLLELQRRMRDLGIKGQNMKKGGVVRKNSIMLKGRGGSFKGVK